MYRLIIVVIAITAFAVGANAGLTGVDIADDGDGAITCTAVWDQSEQLNIDGIQYWGPGHMVGTISTDTPLDPNLILRTTIDNDTGFTWTGYQVNVYLSSNFTVSSILNYTPGDWTGTMTLAPTSGTWIVDGNTVNAYKASILYSGTTPVNDGDTLDFRYKISFSGSTSYSIIQEMAPIPEPATMSLLALGGLALLKRRK